MSAAQGRNKPGLFSFIAGRCRERSGDRGYPVSALLAG